jgi:hypothetical protein
VDAVIGKDSSGPVYTVSLSQADITALSNGETVSEMIDKIVWTVKPASRAQYTLEVGPDALTLLLTMLNGWLAQEADGTWKMTLIGDQGYATIKPLAIGAKTTAGTTVTATTMEIVGGVVPKAK